MSVQVASLLVHQPKSDFESKLQTTVDLEQYRIKNVPSDLFYVRNFITEKEERETMEGICAEPESEWIRRNRQHKQEWGTIVYADGSTEVVGKPLPKWSDAAIDRMLAFGIKFSESDSDRPMFVCANEYPIGYGIHPHQDVDGPNHLNAVVSMHGTALLDFYEPEKEGVKLTLEERHICSVLMEPRSLLVFRDEMFNKLHGIKEVEFDVITEKVVNRGDIPIGTVIPRKVRYSMACKRQHHRHSSP